MRARALLAGPHKLAPRDCQRNICHCIYILHVLSRCGHGASLSSGAAAAPASMVRKTSAHFMVNGVGRGVEDERCG